MSQYPLSPFIEFFDMCDASRADLPTAEFDQFASRLRASLAEYGLDASNPTVLAAVTAGVVEALGATHEHGSVVRGAIALGAALSDLSRHPREEDRVVVGAFSVPASEAHKLLTTKLTDVPGVRRVALT